MQMLILQAFNVQVRSRRLHRGAGDSHISVYSNIYNKSYISIARSCVANFYRSKQECGLFRVYYMNGINSLPLRFSLKDAARLCPPVSL